MGKYDNVMRNGSLILTFEMRKWKQGSVYLIVELSCVFVFPYTNICIDCVTYLINVSNELIVYLCQIRIQLLFDLFAV